MGKTRSIDMTADRAFWAGLAIERYNKRAEESFEKVGLALEKRDVVADSAEQRQRLQELAEILADKQGKAHAFTAEECHAIHAGLVIVARNLRAAKGTVKALGKEEWAEELDKDAEHVDNVAATFAEQTELIAS